MFKQEIIIKIHAFLYKYTSSKEIFLLLIESAFLNHSRGNLNYLNV